MKKFFILGCCCFWAVASIAQSDENFNKWKRQALAKGKSWSNFTRMATAESNHVYYSLYIDEQVVASFADINACDVRKRELRKLAEKIVNENTRTQSSSRLSSRTYDLGARGGLSKASINSLAQKIEQKRDEAVNEQRAKANEKTLASVDKSCDCKRMTNRGYNPDAKSRKFGNNDLFFNNNGAGNGGPSNGFTAMPFSDFPSQYNSTSEALAAAAAQTRAPIRSGVPVNINFNDLGGIVLKDSNEPVDIDLEKMEKFISNGGGIPVNMDINDIEKFVPKGSNEIYVGDGNTFKGVIPQPPIYLGDISELLEPVSKFDAFKKEIGVDMAFRNEVAEPIQSFLEGKAGSLPQLMSNLYKERTGYDIGELRNKKNLTEEERRIVEDYNHFVKQMSIELDYQANEAKKKPNPEKDLIDFAIMANDVYQKDDYVGLKDSNWKALTSSRGVDDEAIARSIDAIDAFNTHNGNNSGFYAQIYKNELTGEYTLAFRGSELTPADWKNNIQQGFSAFSEQYAFAASIGERLSHSDAKINIVGHSLGGGLATVAGLKTGFPTYTYNQADISQGTIDRFKLDVSKSDNITAYYMEGEILTTLQNEIRERGNTTLVPTGKKVKTGSVITEESVVLSTASKALQLVNDPRAKALGGIVAASDKVDNLRAMIDGHLMANTEEYFRSVYSQSHGKWVRYNSVQLVLRDNKTYSSMLIETK